MKCGLVVRMHRYFVKPWELCKTCKSIRESGWNKRRQMLEEVHQKRELLNFFFHPQREKSFFHTLPERKMSKCFKKC